MPSSKWIGREVDGETNVLLTSIASHHRVVDSGLQTSDFVRNATVYQFISSVEAKKNCVPSKSNII